MTPTPEQRAQAAALALERKLARESLESCYRVFFRERGWEPAPHHSLLMAKLQAVTDRKLVHSRTGDPCNNLIFLLPPGAAKSVITSMLFPTWFMQRRPATRVLSTSHNANLIESFSYRARGLIQENGPILGYSLKDDKAGVKTWETTNGCEYRCLGVGAGVSGFRYNVGLIDDYIGSQEDADSQLHRDKIWNWFVADFQPRGEGGEDMGRGNVKIIVANRRHKDDLVGRILNDAPDEWELVKIPYIARENDVLGRAVGERLWPAYYAKEDANIQRLRVQNPRIYTGLYDQDPVVEGGSYFKSEWLHTYTPDEYDALMRRSPRIYGAGDWAVSERKDANRTCLGGAALDDAGLIYILPDIFWKIAGPKEVLENYLAFLKRRSPLVFRSESGHIAKAWGPFLRQMMLEQRIYCHIEEVTPSKSKDVRARSIQGLMSMGRVRFPAYAAWWPNAVRELLGFTGQGDEEDDFVDFLAHLGALVMSMLRPDAASAAPLADASPRITLERMLEYDKKARGHVEPRYNGR